MNVTDSTVSSILMENEHIVNLEGRQKHHNRKKYFEMFQRNST